MGKTLDQLASGLLEFWPEHKNFLTKSLRCRDEATLQTSEILAAAIVKIMGNNAKSFFADYKSTCEALTEEEYYFRRNGTYRFSRYREVAEFVYHNTEYMRTYIRGLLLSQVLWSNHAETLTFYRDVFLPAAMPHQKHLEIGPGHGLLMHLAMSSLECPIFEGWDISETSLIETDQCLKTLGHKKTSYALSAIDATNIPEEHLGKFGSITISEVLEHTENPSDILVSLRHLLSEDGIIFVNIPVNSPAIDHIYHFRGSSEVLDLIKASGYEIISHKEFPMGGYPIEKAVKLKATVSCATYAKRI